MICSEWVDSPSTQWYKHIPRIHNNIGLVMYMYIPFSDFVLTSTNVLFDLSVVYTFCMSCALEECTIKADSKSDK